MRKYSIRINYTASIVCDVLADNEGEALGKAREIAENSEPSDFTFGSELESQILGVNE